MNFFRCILSDRLRRCVDYTTRLGLVVALIIPGPHLRAEPAWGPGHVSPADLPAASEIAADITYAEMLDGIATIMENLDSPQGDLVGLALSLGDDPDAAFAFARDQLVTQPYAGSLRSPQAVLAAGGGNPQDKSEFLMQLLEIMGFDARLARGELSSELAARRFASVCQDKEYSPWPLRLVGLPDEAVRRLHARATHDFKTLEAALNGKMDTALVPDAPEPLHYWVQMRDGERWRDYDPNFSDAAPGQSFSTVQALSRGGADPHLVGIEVKAETLSQGAFREGSVLSHEFTARDIAGAALHLGFSPEAPSTGGIVADKLSASLGLQASMRPVLIVDGEPFRGSSFAAPGLPEAGLFAESTPASVTSIWLELTSKTPDAAPRIERRTIIDLVPPAIRASNLIPGAEQLVRPVQGQRYASALESIHHIVVSHGGLNPSDTAERMAHVMLGLPGLIQDNARGHADPRLSMWMGWVRAETFAVASEALTRAYPALDTCAFVGRPRLYLTSLGVAEGGASARSGIDWALDGIDVAGKPSASEGYRLNLWHSAVQSALETTLAETLNRDPDARILSTSLMLNRGLQVLDESAATDLAQRSNAAFRDLSTGRLLLSSSDQQGIPVWWRVNPVSGQADARLSDYGNGSHIFSGGQDIATFIDEASLNSWEMRGDIQAQERRIERLLEQRRTAARNLKPSKAKGTNEYSMLLWLVAIPSAFATGFVVGNVLMQGASFALYGEFFVPRYR